MRPFWGSGWLRARPMYGFWPFGDSEDKSVMEVFWSYRALQILQVFNWILLILTGLMPKLTVVIIWSYRVVLSWIKDWYSNNDIANWNTTWVRCMCPSSGSGHDQAGEESDNQWAMSAEDECANEPWGRHGFLSPDYKSTPMVGQHRLTRRSRRHISRDM
jgi:hypothetical protein